MTRRNRTIQKIEDKSNIVPIVQTITVQPFNRTSLDLGKWRNNTRSAEAVRPRRVALYDMYHDIWTTDGQVIAVWGKRQDPITTANWEFTDKDGNPVEEINEMIDCIGFEDLLKTIIDTKAWGISAAEATFYKNSNGQNEFDLYCIPRKHLRPEKKIVANHQNDEDGIKTNEGLLAQTVMWFGKPSDLGLLLSASMYSILKRGTTSDYAEFIEIFGRGIVDAEWDGFDETQRQNLAKAIKEMGAGGILIRPSGTKVDIKNSTGNANGQLQDTFITKMDSYISKALLGTTETTDSSKTSGYAQAETHNKQDEKKNDSDLQYVRRYLNTEFIKVLKASGFDTKGGTFVIKKDKNLDKDAYEIHKSMRKDLGIPVDDDFFYETNGVRRPDNYEELKNALDSSKNKEINNNTPEEIEGNNADTPTVSKGKKDTNPDESKEEKGKKLSFFRRLIRLFHPAPTSRNNQLVGAFGDHRTSNIKLAKFAAAKVWDSIKDRIIERAWTGAGKLGFDPELFDFTASALTIAFSEGWLAKPIKLVDLGIEYGVDDPVTMTAYEMNLFRFAGAKTLYDAQQLNELFRKVKNFREFYDNASAMLDVHNRDWLETEYNTAIAVGEMASTYNRLMNQKEDFPYWQYKTIGDERVRHSHTLLHDVVLPWNHPYWQNIMPPNGWGCRCYIVPRTKAEITPEMIKTSEEKVREYMETAEFKKAAKGGWGINRFDKGQVFSENQHYTNDYLDVLSKMNKIDYRAFNLKPMEDNFNKTEFKPKFRVEQKDDAINDFTENLQKVTSKKYGIKDFNNRTITVDKATIRKHTTSRISKYQDRHMYLSEVEKIVSDPDEVWLQSYGQKKNESYVYVKYYQDQAIVVVCTLNDNLELQIETWHKLDDPRLRKGLLIKN